MFYDTLKDRFKKTLEEASLIDDDLEVSSRVLTAREAIGITQASDYPILKGKEYLVEAVFRNCRGQAFTDDPLEFSGSLREILERPLETNRDRCLFIAALNAVLRFLKLIDSTVHCRDKGLEECSGKIAEFVSNKAWKAVGLVGLQPAILRALAALPDSPRIFCLDRDEDLKGKSKSGVEIIWSDDESMNDMFSKVEGVLATGSIIINGALLNVLFLANKHRVPVYFYGTTIAGASFLMGLNRICYNAT